MNPVLDGININAFRLILDLLFFAAFFSVFPSLLLESLELENLGIDDLVGLL